MRPWIIVGLGLFVAIFGIGVLITALPKRRAAAEAEMCKKNLKDLAAFAAMNSDPDPAKAAKAPHEVPAGTIVLSGVDPENRLSWVVAALPTLDQKRQSTTELLHSLDRSQPWTFANNQEAAKRKLVALLCPGNPPALDAEQPAPTQYVGIAGLGTDAALLNFVAPGPAPPRAGCFRYDSPTLFSSILDGLSQSLLFGERAEELGPWLRGGPSTLRGLDDSPNASPLIGSQFGGNHPDASNWAMADGSVRVFTPRVDPRILFSLATIAGKETDAVPE
jgi:prepilin-type processing-associated H-X9-DG protein